MENIDVAVITAMSVEKEMFVSHVQAVESVEIFGFEGKIGYIHGRRVLLLISGLGQVNTSIATTLVAKYFDPKVFLFSGIAGAMNEALQIGDVVIGKKVFSAELLSTRQSNGERVKCRFGSFPTLFHELNSAMIDRVQQLQKLSSFVIKHGLIATSDFFPIPANMPYTIDGEQIDSIDMESSAFAHVCEKFSKESVVIRGISNYVSLNTNVLIEENAIRTAAQHAAEVSVNLIKNIQH